MNQQRKDSRNTKLTSAVRHRDGDSCRYCSKIVYFGGDKKSARAGGYARIGGTMDHLTAGEKGTFETLVVACGECNSTKGANRIELELQPPPARPFYSEATAAWLATHGYEVEASEHRPRAKANGKKPSTQRPVEQPPAAPGSTRQATEASSGHADSSGGLPELMPDQPDPADHKPDGSGFAGSGRDGSGRVGQVRAGSPAPKPSVPPPASNKGSDQSSKRRRRRPRNRSARQ